MLNRKFCLAVVLFLSSALFAAPSGGRYSVTKKISIVGTGSRVYLSVDEAARRLYRGRTDRAEARYDHLRSGHVASVCL